MMLPSLFARRVAWSTRLAFTLSCVLCCSAPLTAADDPNSAASHSDAKSPIVALNSDEQLSAKLLTAYEQKGEGYKPRTEHFLADGRPLYVNRLILEESPYLLQHAHNPVNWYPFGEEAFALAKAEDKPIFLSIGYATCHWCHVMERESFENEPIAKILNDKFISIKVDREQLPDVDALFMSAVLMINGSGGWPMSNFLDSTGRPFHGGTYFPPDFFTNLLNQIDDLWRTEKTTLLDLASDLSEALNRANAIGDTARDVGDREVMRARQSALAAHDDLQGGFGNAPKFPQEALLSFLLNEALLHDDAPSMNAVNFTLQQMAAGGIHDQIGGGFHRYAVDPEWLVPHFEKMLYNQGLLARVFSQAYSMGGDEDHAQTAKGILNYVSREMTSPDGLFYSATDADSEGAEGTFFLWTESELKTLLNAEEVNIARAVWGVTENGNFEHKSILYRPQNLSDVAQELGLDVIELAQQRDRIAQQLLSVRDERIRPLRDEKIITAWNGLMISAFAQAGYELQEQRYIDTAIKAADTLWDKTYRDDKTLWRTLYESRPSIVAKQTDYAYLAEGFLTLYDIDGNERWLARARALADTMVERFWDEEKGGFFLGEAVVSGAALTVRPKDLHDSSMPSGNAVALRVLASLYKRTGVEQYGTLADEQIAAFSAPLAEQPSGFYYMLKGVSEHLFGEAGSQGYAARGVVKATGRKLDDSRVEISIKMKPGWHINSNAPLQNYLIPTAVSSRMDAALTAVQFPDAIRRSLGFERSELSLYEGEISIIANVDSAQLEGLLLPVDIDVQACNEEVCLAPETVSLAVSWVN